MNWKDSNFHSLNSNLSDLPINLQLSRPANQRAVGYNPPIIRVTYSPPLTLYMWFRRGGRIDKRVKSLKLDFYIIYKYQYQK